MLDSRGPPNSYDAEEAAREESVKKEVDRLMKETRLWRVANSAQWVAWGIVQAKVPGMEEALEDQRRKAGAQGSGGESTLELPVKDPTDFETSASSQQHEKIAVKSSIEDDPEELVEKIEDRPGAQARIEGNRLVAERRLPRTEVDQVDDRVDR